MKIYFLGATNSTIPIAEFPFTTKGDPGPKGDRGEPGPAGASFVAIKVTTQAEFDAATPAENEVVFLI